MNILSTVASMTDAELLALGTQKREKIRDMLLVHCVDNRPMFHTDQAMHNMAKEAEIKLQINRLSSLR